MGEEWKRTGLGGNDVDRSFRLLTYDTPNVNRGGDGNAYAKAYASFTRTGRAFDGARAIYPIVTGPPVIPGAVPDVDNMRKGRRVSGELPGTEGRGCVDVGMLGRGVMLSVIDSARIASKTTVVTGTYRNYSDTVNDGDTVIFTGEGGRREWDGGEGEGFGWGGGMMCLYVKEDGRERKRKMAARSDRGEPVHATAGYGNGEYGEYGEEGGEDDSDRKARSEVRKSRLQKQSKVASAVAKSSAARAASGPGVPVLFQNTSKSFVADRDPITPTILSNVSDTGKQAIATATRQKKRLLTSTTNPPGPKLNFGPYGPGFLNSPTGQSGIPLPRPVSGISLPMGVNLRVTERASSTPPWNRLEDTSVRAVASRYGLNWQIASWCVGRASEGGGLGRERRRSARQCLDRWRELAREDGGLQRAVRVRGEEWEAVEHCSVDETGRMLEENMRNHDPTEHEFAGSGTGGQLPPAEQRGDRQVVDSRFSYLKAAMAKKRNPPGIPGCQDATSTLVPPHSSHTTTSSSAASSLALNAGLKESTVSGGELWPLQLLETFRLRGRAVEEEEGRGRGGGKGEGEEREKGEGERKGSNGDAAGTPAATVPATPRQQTKEQLSDAQLAQNSVLVAARDAAMQLASSPQERATLAEQYEGHIQLQASQHQAQLQRHSQLTHNQVQQQTAAHLLAQQNATLAARTLQPPSVTESAQRKYEQEKAEYDRQQAEYLEKKRLYDEYQRRLKAQGGVGGGREGGGVGDGGV